ncbi:MAG: outer membrane protein assembly factor BamA [Verrucomicrobium sp.]|nr:outer membrane protein assembly factor BamA [Verrucomicrobium sp.]
MKSTKQRLLRGKRVKALFSALLFASFSFQAFLLPAGAQPLPAGEQKLNVPQVPDAEKRTVQAPDAVKDTNYGPVVKDIEVVYVGPQSVNKSVILSNMRTAVGQPYSPATVEEDVRNLYATGLFTNLRISDQPLATGIKVTVVVQPKPLVKEIIINGAKQIKEKRLRKEIHSKAGEPLSEEQIAEDCQKMRDYYQNKGFNNVQITYKIDVNEQFGRAVVIFTVNEGAKAFIRQIVFAGNKAFTEKELRKTFKKTRVKDLISFIDKSGLFKEDDFQDDLQHLKEFYQNHGYIDVEVKKTAITYPKPEEMKLTITVFEGIQYHVGSIKVDGNTLYDVAAIRKALKMGEGAVFSPKGLQDDVKAIRDLYGKNGYIDAEVRPDRISNVESAKIDLDYHIVEGAQSFVDRIIIQGNNRTKDKVLRRELPLAPGDVYDSVRVDAAKKRLENLGYFEKVDISPQDTSVPNRRNMVVTVEEKRTGNITFGVGFSSVDSLLGFVELSQGNFDIGNWPYFTGGGQKFRTRVQYGLVRKDFTLSFTEPWFMDKPLSVGFDLFAHQFNNDYQNALYSQLEIGADARVSKQLTPFWTATVMYKLQEISLYDFDSSTAASIPGLYAQRGSRSESSVTASLSYDTRDNIFLTRRGEQVNFIVQGAGGPLLGQTDIYKLEANAQKFFPLPWDLIFSMKGATGVVNSYGDMQSYPGDSNKVPLFDRFFLGGSRSVRGFQNRGVGPVYPGTDQPTGGDTYGYINFELTWPIIDRVRGAVFYDAGFVDQSFAAYGDILPDYNAAVGVGLRLNLPIGPLRFDYGVPVKYDSWNKSSGRFSFDVGYQF